MFPLVLLQTLSNPEAGVGLGNSPNSERPRHGLATRCVVERAAISAAQMLRLKLGMLGEELPGGPFGKRPYLFEIYAPVVVSQYFMHIMYTTACVMFEQYAIIIAWQ